MVDKFADLISFLGHNLIQGIFVSVLLIIAAKSLSKNKIETYFSAQIIRCIMIAYALGGIVNILLLLSLLTFEQTEHYAILNRATGPYWWAYLLILGSNTILPLFLINKKIGENLLILLTVAVLMNLGWLFESFVVHVTSIHGNFATENYNPYIPNAREIRILLHGFFIGLFCLIVGNGIKEWKARLGK